MKIGNLSFERTISIKSEFLGNILGKFYKNSEIQSHNHYGNALDIEKFAFDIVNIWNKALKWVQLELTKMNFCENSYSFIYSHAVGMAIPTA